MKVKPEVIINGLIAYIDGEIISQLSGLQGLAARTGLVFLNNRSNTIVGELLKNKLIATIGIVDGNGMADTEELYAAFKEAMKKQGIVVIPTGFADITLKEADVDVIKSYIDKHSA